MRKFSEEHLRNLSLSHLGHKSTKEQIKKCIESRKWYKHSKETKGKISRALIGHYGWFTGKKHTLESRKKMSKASKGQKVSLEQRIRHSKLMTGRKASKETKRKMRESHLKYLKKVVGKVIFPNIGKKEKEILDKIEKEENIKIQRQYRVNGYFLDGYCSDTNIVYEVDDKGHFKDWHKGIRKIKDINRQKEIEEELGCDFVRIKDWEWLDGN